MPLPLPLLQPPPAEVLAAAAEAGGTEEGVEEAEAEEVTEDGDEEDEAAAEVAVEEGKSSLRHDAYQSRMKTELMEHSASALFEQQQRKQELRQEVDPRGGRDGHRHETDREIVPPRQRARRGPVRQQAHMRGQRRPRKAKIGEE